MNVDSQSVLEDRKLLKNKLKNMNNHLEALLNKKLRLEIEIRTLKKSIKEKEKNFKKNSLKISASLEGYLDAQSRTTEVQELQSLDRDILQLFEAFHLQLDEEADILEPNSDEFEKILQELAESIDAFWLSYEK